MTSLYAALKAAGCELDSHESDLYVKASAVATLILKRYAPQWRQATSFVSRTDGGLWYDVPFAYLPWWEKRSGRAQAQLFYGGSK